MLSIASESKPTESVKNQAANLRMIVAMAALRRWRESEIAYELREIVYDVH